MHDRVSRRRLRGAAVLVGGLLLLAGCTGRANPARTAGAGASTVTATQPPSTAQTGSGPQRGTVGSTQPASARGSSAPATAHEPSRSAAAAASTANGRSSSGGASGSATLSPAAGWTTQITPSICGTMDTRELRPGVVASPVSPRGGGLLTVFLQNSTDLCGGRGSTLRLQGALSLDLEPLGASGQGPLAQASLPAPPPSLPSGGRADLAVRVSAGFQPGWYAASLTGTLRVNGAPFQLSGPPPFGASGDVLVAGANRPAGTATRTVGPAPTVGGLAMPLIKLSWTSTDAADFEVHAPVVCGPGTDRAAQFGAATATVSGAGFTTGLPSVGGGDNPAKAESSFDFAPFPGEATSLLLRVPVQVRACDGTRLGPALGSGIAAWQVVLPGDP